MSYSEKDGQVILTMSREDYERLRLCIDAAESLHRHQRASFPGIYEFSDRLNSGNPSYTPYRTGEKK